MILNPTTDLTPFAGARVTARTGDGPVTAKIGTIRHGADARSQVLHGGVYGLCVEEAHAGCRGGSTAFWWPYGSDLSLEEAK